MQVERGILDETSVDSEIPSGGRVSNAWATCPVQGDNSWKRLLIPHKIRTPHDDRIKDLSLTDGLASD